MPKPFIPRDRLASAAVALGYLARSAFKLKEITAKFKIIKPGDIILDLGSSPGSWLQVAAAAVGPKGRVLGIDKNPIAWSAPNVTTLQHDILSPEIINLISPFAPFDAVISDLAPKTTGIRDRDQALSLELSERALALARLYLRRGGNLVIKIFQSPDTRHFVKEAKGMFKTVHLYKPRASRDRSFETYLIGLNKID